MTDRERLLAQIRRGQPMVVGGGGNTIRPVGEPAPKGQTVKPHTWGRW